MKETGADCLVRTAKDSKIIQHALVKHFSNNQNVSTEYVVSISCDFKHLRQKAIKKCLEYYLVPEPLRLAADAPLLSIPWSFRVFVILQRKPLPILPELSHRNPQLLPTPLKLNKAFQYLARLCLLNVLEFRHDIVGVPLSTFSLVILGNSTEVRSTVFQRLVIKLTMTQLASSVSVLLFRRRAMRLPAVLPRGYPAAVPA